MNCCLISLETVEVWNLQLGRRTLWFWFIHLSWYWSRVIKYRLVPHNYEFKSLHLEHLNLCMSLFFFWRNVSYLVNLSFIDEQIFGPGLLCELCFATRFIYFTIVSFAAITFCSLFLLSYETLFSCKFILDDIYQLQCSHVSYHMVGKQIRRAISDRSTWYSGQMDTLNSIVI